MRENSTLSWVGVQSVIVTFRGHKHLFFMLSLSGNTQGDVIAVFNSTSRYQDDVLNIDNQYFEQVVT